MSVELLAHSGHGSDHGGGGGWASEVLHSIVRGFGWAIGRDAGDATFHILGLVGVLALAVAIGAGVWWSRRKKRSQ